MSTVPNFLNFTINALFFAQPLPVQCGNLYRFVIKIVSSLPNGVKVAEFAWYSVKIGVIFGVRFERWKIDKK